MNRKFWLCGLVLFVGMIFVGMASSAAAQDFGQGAAPCYFCIRDAIYADVKLINHEEANPDIDEGQKGPGPSPPLNNTQPPRRRVAVY